MKKLFKLLVVLFVLCSITTVVSCDDKEPEQQVVTIDSISVDETSIPTSILNTEVENKLSQIKINVLKSDGSTEVITLNKSMISSDDLAKLSEEGSHTITVNYEGKTTSLTVNIKKESQGTVEKDPIPYTVEVKDIAGKPLAEFYVTFYLGDEIVDEGYTGGDGKFTLELLPNIYDVVVEGREGYFLNNELFTTDLVGTTINVVCEIDSLAGVEAEADHLYGLGDVMYDFTVVDTDGNELTLYDLLNDYKAVLLNFWYTTCSACYYEFPYMIEAYDSIIPGTDKKYSDEIAIIAINPGIAGNGDTMDDIRNFKNSNGLNFFVAMDYDSDKSNLTMDPALTRMFNITGYPTTVVIDSYGLIANVEVGAVTATEKWTQTFDKYIADNYTPEYTGDVAEDEFVKPNITQPDSSEIAAVINGTNYTGEKFETTYTPEDNKDAEYSWPWIVTEYKGVPCIKPSNNDQNPSFAIMYFTVQMKKGETLVMDYFASSESYDTLYITVNEVIATSISGQSPNWETSYVFVAVEDGEYEFGFCYLKDGSYSMGEDAVFVKNIRIETEEHISKPTYIFRECANGTVDEISMSYQSYVEVFYNEEDGYYHVGSVNGPLLLADMLSGTRWNNSDLYTISLEGTCIGADGVDYNALVEKYAVYASNSTIGYCPVTMELADALKQIVKALGDPLAKNNKNQWLELCVYYSAYATEELGIPTIGVCPFEPIMFEGDGIDEAATAEAEFNRIILPRGFIFGFVPEVSGVYKFYSTEEELETVGWICDSDAIVTAESDYGLRIFAQQSTNGELVDHNFVAYIYLEAGELYLFRAAFYDIYEYSTITVEMKYVSEELDLLTIASPGFFTSSDEDMSDIISGNYVDVELGDDGYYHVVGSEAADDYVYCDVAYINNITGYSLLQCLAEPFRAFDFSKDEYGKPLYDENGYYRVTGYDENDNLVRYFVCYDEEGNYYYVLEVGEGEYTVENGYTYVMFNADELDSLSKADFTEYVSKYIEDNMISDKTSELYGCVKVDEKFAIVLGMFMDKYTFADVQDSWVKLCYYFKHLGA